MVKRPINQKLIGKDYIGLIEADGRAAYDELNKHFGELNLLHKLRNTIAYHHPSAQELEAAFEDVPEDEDWAWYPSDTINNSFYLASDMVISSGILRVTGEADTAKAFRKVMGVVTPVSNDMIDFFMFLMRAIVARHLGADFLKSRDGTKIVSAPNLIQGRHPVFYGERRRPTSVLEGRFEVAGVLGESPCRPHISRSFRLPERASSSRAFHIAAYALKFLSSTARSRASSSTVSIARRCASMMVVSAPASSGVISPSLAAGGSAQFAPLPRPSPKADRASPAGLCVGAGFDLDTSVARWCLPQALFRQPCASEPRPRRRAMSRRRA